MMTKRSDMKQNIIVFVAVIFALFERVTLAIVGIQVCVAWRALFWMVIKHSDVRETNYYYTLFSLCVLKVYFVIEMLYDLLLLLCFEVRKYFFPQVFE